MADNINVTPGAGATVAADEVSGALHQRVKVSLGADGVAVDAVGGAGAVSTGVQRVTLASDDPAVALLSTMDADTGAVAKSVAGNYETIAAGVTDQVLGASGAAGDMLSHVVIVPASTSPGGVVVTDGATAISIFAGGAESLSNLVPFVVALNMSAVAGPWKVSTGANVSAIAVT